MTTLLNTCKAFILIILESAKIFVLTTVAFATFLLLDHKVVFPAVMLVMWCFIGFTFVASIRVGRHYSKRRAQTFKEEHSYILKAPRFFYVGLQVIEIVMLCVCLYVTYSYNAASYDDLKFAMESGVDVSEDTVIGGACVLRSLPVAFHKPIAVYYKSAFAYELEKDVDEDMARTLFAMSVNDCNHQACIQGILTVAAWLLYGAIRYPGQIFCQYVKLLKDSREDEEDSVSEEEDCT